MGNKNVCDRCNGYNLYLIGTDEKRLSKDDFLSKEAYVLYSYLCEPCYKQCLVPPPKKDRNLLRELLMDMSIVLLWIVVAIMYFIFLTN